jgi:hypothetical protein
MMRSFYPKPFPRESILSIALRACGADTIRLGVLLLNLGGPSNNIHALLVPALMGQKTLLHDLAQMEHWRAPKPHLALLRHGTFGRWIDYEDGRFCAECAQLGALPWIHDFQPISVCQRHYLKFVTHCDKCRRAITWNRRDLNLCVCGHTLKGGARASTKDLERGAFIERLIVTLQFESLERILTIERALNARYELDVDLNILDQFIKGNIEVLVPTFRGLMRRTGNLPPRAVVAPLLSCGGWMKPLTDSLSLHLSTNCFRKNSTFSCPSFYLNRNELAYALGTALNTAGAIQQIFLPRSKMNRKTLSGDKLVELYTTLTPTGSDNEGSSAQLLRMSSDQAIAAVRRERLSVIVYDPHKPLSAARFAKVSRDKAWLTLTEAANGLGTYYEAVRHLGKIGLLSMKYQEARYWVDTVKLADFKQKYILIGEIATRANSKDRRLSEKVMAWGAKPVSGPLVDGGLIYLFRRNDIDKLDLLQVAATTHYATNSGRRPKPAKSTSLSRCLDGKETARALGVSVQRLTQFEDAGLLRREYPTEGSTHRRYYCEKSVRHAESFVKELVAFRDFEKTCRLKGNMLVRRHRAICSDPMFRIQGPGWHITSSAANATMNHVERFWDADMSARYLGVTSQDIQNWRKLGHLVPLQEGDKGFIPSPMLYRSKDILAFKNSSTMLERSIALKRKRLRH